MTATFQLPRIGTYGQYRNDNYGVHCMAVDMGPVTVWFSCKTPIAFQVDGLDMVVRKNDWGKVTGRHLNWLTDRDKKCRVDKATFERLWAEQVEVLVRPKPEDMPTAPSKPPEQTGKVRRQVRTDFVETEEENDQ